MYRIIHVKDIVRIPPDMFEIPLEDAAWKMLRQQYEGISTRELGIVVAVFNINVSEEGRIIPGDGATYHDVEFDMLVFNPFLREVVEGEVNGVRGHGLFVDLGAVDGFIHISQIADEQIEYDPTRPALILTETRRLIEMGDRVRARVYNVSLLPGKGLRVQLTMRQPYMGKLEWIEKLKKEVTRAKKGGS